MDRSNSSAWLLRNSSTAVGFFGAKESSSAAENGGRGSLTSIEASESADYTEWERSSQDLRILIASLIAEMPLYPGATARRSETLML